MASRYTHNSKANATGFSRAAFLVYTRKMPFLKIPQIFFDSLFTMSDSEVGSIVKSLIIYMMTDGEAKPDLKFESKHHSSTYDAMVDVTRGYITSLKGHLKGETIEEKQAFKAKYIGYDTEAIEAAIDAIQDVLDEDGGDYDEMADGLPDTSLALDTIEQEEAIKRKGGKVKKPSPFSPRRDILKPSLMPLVSDDI